MSRVSATEIKNHFGKYIDSSKTDPVIIEKSGRDAAVLISFEQYKKFSESFALELNPELEERLDRLSKKTHKSKGFYAQEALKHYIEDLEDYYLATSVLNSSEKIYSLEEVEKMCGLGD